MICYVAEVQNIPGLLLLVDFEKAFDSVSHDFLFNVLDNFNFGPSMKKWIHAFYDQATSSVLVNDFVSESFATRWIVVNSSDEGWISEKNIAVSFSPTFRVIPTRTSNSPNPEVIFF